MQDSLRNPPKRELRLEGATTLRLENVKTFLLGFLAFFVNATARLDSRLVKMSLETLDPMTGKLVLLTKATNKVEDSKAKYLG